VAWINTGMLDPPNVVTNPSTNRARRSVTSLMWRTSLPLRQTSHRVICLGDRRLGNGQLCDKILFNCATKLDDNISG